MKCEILMNPSALSPDLQKIQDRAKKCKLMCMNEGCSWEDCIHGFACEIRKILIGKDCEAE